MYIGDSGGVSSGNGVSRALAAFGRSMRSHTTTTNEVLNATINVIASFGFTHRTTLSKFNYTDRDTECVRNSGTLMNNNLPK